MKKAIISAVFIFLIFPLAIAADLTVRTIDKENVIITEMSNNAKYTLSITNNENQKDEFQIYSLISATIYPQERFIIDSGDTMELNVEIAPHKETIRENRGIYIFEYQIKGQKTGFFKDFFTIKILDVKDAVLISIGNIKINDTNAKIKIQNLEDFSFNGLKISAKSDFFEFSETFDLDKKESIEFITPITNTKKLSAGEHDVEATYELNGIISKKTNTLNYLEQGGISVSEKSEGFIIRKTTTTKINAGNIPTEAVIQSKKNILTRLFTTHSIKPDESERNGIFIQYVWKRDLGVGESITITSTTNYTFPFILLIIIILVAVATKYLASKKVIIRKRVSPVKTKGGEFALKVKLKIKARSKVSNIVLSDVIPRMAKLYEKYSKPHKIDIQSRKISWQINNLNAGEERVFTYIIYSKINIVGTFELPQASASYDLDGMKEHSFSNTTSFIAETAE
ncbi:MAG: hypothetical protein Q8P57_00185 [Candidatus Pacearchaeota archaeon]|nr:hypothetical protein [Candidatus Pacearchaeota archaeon]